MFLLIGIGFIRKDDILNSWVLMNNYHTRDALSEHQENENRFQSQSHHCDKCNRIYSHQQSLRNHQKFECGKVAQFACSYCDYRCKRKGNMKTHIIHVHSRVLQN
ncbi:longitudinals lacking protein, isoforms A/B/D/L-like [Thrips palmi]|uniref:Longitudinals lacking protein, isoforms A/B/D/L-like n=1 Tax=Thrips palmi TaxID=161013 RepID=A0A6P8ZX78_THRPL|nr:longitudinals lacking protein, isoforms A/B/D/L-like [Thrips palmi]